MAENPMRVVVLGAGGHCRAVLAALRHHPELEVAGILDGVATTRGERIGESEVLGSFSLLDDLAANGVRAAAPAVGDGAGRAALLARALALGMDAPALRHGAAIVDYGATVGDGSLICAGAVLGPFARLGKGAILNTGAILDHESRLGDFSHLCPGARAAGRVVIGDYCMIGTGASIADRVTIGSGVTVGAGAVVVDDLPDDVVAVGVPARIIRHVK